MQSHQNHCLRWSRLNRERQTAEHGDLNQAEQGLHLSIFEDLHGGCNGAVADSGCAVVGDGHEYDQPVQQADARPA
ncbi:hypothetical protein KCU81_g85, partial [Aureobasidium melanogenum]